MQENWHWALSAVASEFYRKKSVVADWLRANKKSGDDVFHRRHSRVIAKPAQFSYVGRSHSRTFHLIAYTARLAFHQAGLGK
jgi:hypothetical protein